MAGRAIALLIVCLVGVPASASEPAPITRSELRSLSDEALVIRVFGPLARDLFVSRIDRESILPRRPVEIWFSTRARPSDAPGVCVTDRSIVRFEPALPWTDSQPMRLRAIETQASFIIQNRDLAMRETGIDASELEGFEERCAALDPRRDSTPADSGWQLVKAISLINELGEAARAGRAPVPIDCQHLRFSGPPPTNEAECLRELSHLGEHSVGWVQGCAEAVVINGTCIRVLTNDWFIYFILTTSQRMERVIVRGIEDTSAVQ